MKIKTTSGVALTGTRHGVVYTAPGETNLGRARVVPLQPRTNNQNSVALSVAAAAQLWKLIPAIDRTAWSDFYGGAIPGYNAFVKINSNAFTWGSSALVTTPYSVLTPALVFATLFAEPDGIHTTLAIALSGPVTGSDECWVRLYINFQQVIIRQKHPAARAVYFGSFGPLTGIGVELFDVTGLMTQNAGQWWYPSSVDTASQLSCGNVCYANLYVTDRFGMPSGSAHQYPLLDQFAGIEPGQLGPGVCPILTTPPYPWPTAHQFYGVPVITQQPFGADLSSPPLVSSLQWINQGAATGTDERTGILLVAPKNAGDQLRCLVLPTYPARPYTFTVAFTMSSAEVAFEAAGIVLTDGTKFVTLHAFTGPNLAYTVFRWSSASVNAGQYFSNIPLPPNQQIWMQVTDDGTNLTFRISYNGYDFTAIPPFTTSRTSYMPAGPTRVGIFADANNSSQGIAALFISWAVT